MVFCGAPMLWVSLKEAGDLVRVVTTQGRTVIVNVYSIEGMIPELGSE